MKNSNLLLPVALIILVVGIVMYKKSQETAPVASSKTPTPAPAPASGLPAAAATASACTQPGAALVPSAASSDIVQGTQIMDSGTMTEMQTFIR